jgi:RecG-like helicase
VSSCRGSRNNYYLCSAFASVNYLFLLIDLSTPITYLPGVGPQRAKLLESELNISTFRDLLYYFPYKHIDRTRLYYVHELTP